MSTTSLPMIKEEDIWFSKGLPFKCTQCGQCCTGAPGYTWVSEEEMIEIATLLKMNLHDFKKQFIRKVDERYALHEDPINYDCIFLKEKKCQVYQARPIQCRTFPWWPSNLETPEDWKETALRCEGINPDAPIVPLATIIEQLLIETNMSS